MVLKVAFEDIPSDPTRDIYRRAARSAKNTSIGSGRNSCSGSACSFAIDLRQKIQPVSAQSLPDHASKASELRSTDHIGVRFAPKAVVEKQRDSSRFCIERWQIGTPTYARARHRGRQAPFLPNRFRKAEFTRPRYQSSGVSPPAPPH